MNRSLHSYRMLCLPVLLLLVAIANQAYAQALSVTIAKTKGITCAGNTDGVFKATPTGGTSPYTYLWSNGDTGQSTTTGLAPGTYTCKVTDAANNSVTSSGLAIAAPKAIAITASTQTNATTSGGSDGSATITTVTGGTQPYTYSWTSSTTSATPTGNGTSQISGLAAGTWTVLVSDNNHCTAATKTFTITEPAAALSVTILKTTGISCSGATDGIFKATPLGGTAPYTYLWSNGDTGQSTTAGLAPGTYTCTVKDATGNTATSTGLLIAAPKAISITVYTQTNVTSTGGNDGSATVTIVAGGSPPYTYSWTSSTTSAVPTGNGTNQITGLVAGTWTVSVSDKNSCTAATQTFTITESASTVYYSKPTGNLSTLSTYGTSADGTGTAPTDFNGSGTGAIYQLANRSAYTLSADLTLGSTLNIPGGSTLDIAGNNLTINTLSGGGTLTGSNTSSLTVNGTISSLSFTSGKQQINNFTLGSGASVTVSTALDIAGTGKITLGANAILNTGGFLTLKSDASGSASVAVLGTGASIAGNVIVERYLFDKRAWRLISPAVNSSQTINAAWQEGAGGTTNDPNPGFGTFTLGASKANGFDIVGTSASLLVYNGVAFNSIANTNVITLNSNPGYFLFSIGNRSVDPATASNHSWTVLRSTGTLRTGTQIATITAAGYTLIGNPYAAAVDFAQVTRTATVPNQFYVWDINLGSYGGYVLVTNSSGTYTSVPASPSGLSNIIPSGAAIFVQSDGSTTGSLTFNENCKASAAGSGTFSSFATSVASTDQHNFRINLTDTNTTLIDGVMTSFSEGYSNKIDVADAPKLLNFYENIALNRSGKLLTLERRSDITAKDTIFIRLSGIKEATYQLQLNPTEFNEPGMAAYLEDAYLHTRTQLNLNQVTNLSFIASADSASYKDRFKVSFNPGTSPTKISHASASVIAYPNPAIQKQINLSFDGLPAANYSITVMNTFGQVMQKSNMVFNGSTTNKQLSADYISGVYTVNIQSTGYNQSIKVIIP